MLFMEEQHCRVVLLVNQWAEILTTHGSFNGHTQKVQWYCKQELRMFTFSLMLPFDYIYR
jgi:hypothetical protein